MLQTNTDWRKAWLSIFTPPFETCLCCGQWCKIGGQAFQLCETCREQIPWIKKIQCCKCGRPVECPDCVGEDMHTLVNNRSAVQYSDQMREWLALYKYRGNERLLPLLGEMMLPVLRAIVSKQGRSRIVLTFVPLSNERQEERGFNQAEQLAQYLGRRTGIPVYALLKRYRHTHKQSFKSRRERMRDLIHVFRIHAEGVSQLQHDPNDQLCILLVDDVYTTGSTVNQCARVIQEQVASSVFSLTWARA